MPWKIRLKPIRTVVGILKRDNKILVAERPDNKPYAGYWEFPGGKIEENESSNAALIRELHEELGIRVISAQPWFEHTHAYPDKIVLLEMWLVTEFLGEPHGKENQTLQWATFPELVALRLLEGNWAIIERIKNLI